MHLIFIRNFLRKKKLEKNNLLIFNHLLMISLINVPCDSPVEFYESSLVLKLFSKKTEISNNLFQRNNNKFEYLSNIRKFNNGKILKVNRFIITIAFKR